MWLRAVILQSSVTRLPRGRSQVRIPEQTKMCIQHLVTGRDTIPTSRCSCVERLTTHLNGEYCVFTLPIFHQRDGHATSSTKSVEFGRCFTSTMQKMGVKYTFKTDFECSFLKKFNAVNLHSIYTFSHFNAVSFHNFGLHSVAMDSDISVIFFISVSGVFYYWFLCFENYFYSILFSYTPHQLDLYVRGFSSVHFRWMFQVPGITFFFILCVFTIITVIKYQFTLVFCTKHVVLITIFQGFILLWSSLMQRSPYYSLQREPHLNIECQHVVKSK